ncbi:DNA polymerase III subunit gamma/tau [Chlamydia trachomatis]|nr:DNA polymerase III subunit gamma/tau [Chlamydia trachomatis]
MKQELLKQLQPQLFERFSRILEANRLGHAYLFSGNFASFDMAKFLTQAVFCQESDSALPCGHCRNCRLVEQEEFPDMTIVAPQGNVIKTDTVRNLVKDFSQSGFEGNRQVFIIRDAEKMHPNAANSLLKAIEEPQSDIHIFLITNQEEAVLPTIKSRTQLVSFPKNIAYMTQILEEKGLLKNQAWLLAHLATGLEEAEQLAQQKSILDSLQVSKKFVETLLVQPQKAYLMVGKLVQLASEKADQGRLFELLGLYLSEQLTEKRGQAALAGLLDARKMWMSNVSFQNALEFWVLILSKKK